MKVKIFVFIYFCFLLHPALAVEPADSAVRVDNVVRMDSLIEYLFRQQTFQKAAPVFRKDTVAPVFDTIPEKKRPPVDTVRIYQKIDLDKLLEELSLNGPAAPVYSFNRSYLGANPFFGDLRFQGFSSETDMFTPRYMDDYYREKQLEFLVPNYFIPVSSFETDRIIRTTREMFIRRFSAYHPEFIVYRIDKLPDVTELTKFKIDIKPIEKTIMLPGGTSGNVQNKIEREKVRLNPWTNRSQAMLQFSQNFVSENWYQGGSDNTAVLGIVNGRFNYDNKKNIQWENFVEWRLGFNTIEGDTIRFLNTNDDILRATSKLGIKAGGNWFYSGTVDFATQFFNSYKAVNSTAMKAAFLTPVRFNVGVGLDYKYKKLFSLMLSPLSYKFISVNDTVNIDKKSFGILPGEKILSQIGSSFRAEFAYSPSRDIQINSRLLFYTNYEKVEVDWEVIGNFTINRFLSTRISLNPRYDNTVILAKGEKAKLQFKELLTFGLSYRLL